MKYHQRDIVEIDFPIPGEGYIKQKYFDEIVDKIVESIF